jgi:hypothetical protein
MAEQPENRYVIELGNIDFLKEQPWDVTDVWDHENDQGTVGLKTCLDKTVLTTFLKDFLPADSEDKQEELEALDDDDMFGICLICQKNGNLQLTFETKQGIQRYACAPKAKWVRIYELIALCDFLD